MQQPSKISPVDFLDYYVKPALLNNLSDFLETEIRTVKPGWVDVFCPKCGQPRAVFYPNTMSAFCNRRNECGWETTAWDLVGHRPGLRGREFVEAVKVLAKRLGVDTAALDVDLSPDALKKIEAQQSKEAIWELVAKVCARRLHEESGKRGAVYLRRRGFPLDKAEELGVGYMPENVHALLADPEFEGVKQSHLKAAGFDQRWKDRIVVPYRNRAGRIVQYYGRTCGDETPPHLYLDEATAPNGRDGLFGLDTARKVQTLVVFEGIFDALTAKAHGMLNTAAAGTNRITDKQAKEIVGLGLTGVTLCLDDDHAGITGALESVTLLYKTGLARAGTGLYAVPPGALRAAVNKTSDTDKVDPDMVIQSLGMEGLGAVIGNALDGWALYPRNALAEIDLSTPVGRGEAIWRLIESSACLSPRHTREMWVSVAKTLNINPDEMQREVEEIAERRRLRKGKEKIDRALARIKGAESVSPEDMDGLNALYSTVYGSREARIETQAWETTKAFIRTLQNPGSFGWKSLDAAGFELPPGDVAVVCGRPNQGKTTFLLAVARKWLAAHPGQHVLYFGYEEGAAGLSCKNMAAWAWEDGICPAGKDGWSARQIFRCIQQAPGQWPTQPAMLDEVAERHKDEIERLCFVTNQIDLRADQLADEAIRASERFKVGLVVVDYTQKVPPPKTTQGKSSSRPDIEISATVDQFKRAALTIGAPLVAGAQLGRGSKRVERNSLHENGGTPKPFAPDLSKAFKSARPSMEDIRGGGVEQGADIIVALMNYRKDYLDLTSNGAGLSNPNTRTPLAVGLIKDRGGPGDKWVPLSFFGHYSSIGEAMKEWE